ncbi:MAG: EscU/YscU/HrcU family type III secretion system export apparatus switch protein [Gammaproteobacteria bacterium]
MADESGSSEKQHQASAKRIENLRSQGNILRSKDLTSGLIIIVGLLSITFMSARLGQRLTENFVLSFRYMATVGADWDFPSRILERVMLDNFIFLMPFFGVVILTAVLSPFAFGGWNFTLKAIEFKPEKFDLVKNLGNIFSKKMFFDIARSLFKVCIIMGALIFFAMDERSSIQGLMRMNMAQMSIHVHSIILEFIVVISLAILIIMGADAAYHYYEYQNKTKMTSQELKDEGKESEGSPEVKRKIRSAQFALMNQRLSTTVPKADVIVTNPTHYAIALRYDEGTDKAPRVLAKGKGFIANQIRRLAITNGIPMYEAPLLARAIYRTSDINTEVHPALYMAVAIVLSYVQQLKNYQQGFGGMPVHTRDLQIPKEFIYDE